MQQSHRNSHPGGSRASKDGNDPRWTSHRRHDQEHGSFSPRGQVQASNAVLLESISDSPFGPEWSSWLHSVGGDLDLDGSLNEGLGMSFDPAPSYVPTPPDTALTPDATWRDFLDAPKSESDFAGALNLENPFSLQRKHYQPTPSSQAQVSPNTSSLLSSPERSRCSCLQQLVQLVYHLEDLQYAHTGSPSIDSVLHGVRKAQAPWKRLMQCSHCRSNYDTEVFLLFAMSIRTLLSSVQVLYTAYQNASQDLQTAPSSATVSPPESTAESEEFSVSVSVGNYELVAEEKSLALGLMIRNALRSIAAAFVYLWERTDQSIPLSHLRDTHRTAGVSPGSCVNCDSNGLLQRLRQYPLDLSHLGAEDVRSLLDHLQTTMRTLEGLQRQNEKHV
ncbi:hypothetical protein EYZ11_005665 [Aspergillus tanneri]|nr:hypothetical protein EYZ11_005665 [Aspergillus tanneri]